MYMIKLTKQLFCLALLASVASGCGSETETETDDVSNGNVGQELGCNVVFQLQTPAVDGSVTRGVDDSYEAEQGTEKEWTVGKVKIFLFDIQTKLCAKTVELTKLERSQGTVNGHVTYLSKPVAVAQGRYDIFAVANFDGEADTSDEMKFLASVDAATYKQGLVKADAKAMVMSNRASANTGVELKESKEDNLVSITLERVVARIDIAKKYDAYELKDKAGKKYAEVSLDGFHFFNLPKSYYLFRHTAALTSMTEPEWDLATNFGDIPDVNGYAIDPYFFKKNIDATGFADPDSYYEQFSGNLGTGDNLAWTEFSPAAATPTYKTYYSLENCTMWQAQKRGYSTGAVFKASFVPNNNVHATDASGNLVPVEPSAYPDRLYFYDAKFYTSVEALAKAGVDMSNADDAAELDYYGVRLFEKKDGKYVCYYKYLIRHLDNNDPFVMGVMEFATVRNNLYRLLVTGVSELGDSTPQIDPDTPDEGETSIKALLNVKPWVVRDQTNITL